MKTNYIIAPILVIALIGAVAAPPAQAELVTLTVILAAAFATAIIANETLNSGADSYQDSKKDQPNSFQRASSNIQSDQAVVP